MAINPHSVVGFLLRQAGYAEAEVGKILGIVQEKAPAVETVLQAISAAITDDAGAFAAGGPVASPAIDVSIDGHAYSVTVNFQPK